MLSIPYSNLDVFSRHTAIFSLPCSGLFVSLGSAITVERWMLNSSAGLTPLQIPSTAFGISMAFTGKMYAQND